MPVLPNVFERFLARRGKIPPLLLDLGIPMFQTGAMLAALDVGIFEALDDDEPRDLETLSRETGAAERGLRNLLDVLVPLGYVEEDEGGYRLSPLAARTLPMDQIGELYPFMRAQAEEFLEAGRGVREAPEDGIVGWETVRSGEVGRSYQAAMRWLASLTVDEVVDAVDLSPPPRRMLDVGGAHALYTVAFCEKYPGLEGAVLDWEIGLESARETLEDRPEMAERIDLVELDFEEAEELPGGYDFAFLGNIVHGISPEGNRELFGKLGRATTDRGAVALVDQLAGVSGSHFSRSVAALLGFNLFLFSGGRSYEYDRLTGWLAEAGFVDAERTSLRQPGFILVVARKEG